MVSLKFAEYFLASFRPSWRQLARAGIQENQMLLDARFRGHDKWRDWDFFCKLLSQDTRGRPQRQRKSASSNHKLRRNHLSDQKGFWRRGQDPRDPQCKSLGFQNYSSLRQLGLCSGRTQGQLCDLLRRCLSPRYGSAGTSRHSSGRSRVQKGRIVMSHRMGLRSPGTLMRVETPKGPELKEDMENLTLLRSLTGAPTNA